MATSTAGKLMRLTSVSIERFKRLLRVDFDLSGVNVLIGGNNSGKSTIIQGVHFALTLLQSLNISNKWPVTAKKSSTISPSELIYIPSEDPYSLGFGGRLLEDEDKSISITLHFDNGEKLTLLVRKGRITNIIVEPSNIEFARKLSSLDEPFSVFSPGLAGIAKNENLVSDGVLLRAIARGDANSFLRNILHRLHKKAEWEDFETDLAVVFPGIKLKVKFEPAIDQYIEIRIAEQDREVPLDLAGTGLLQSIQILAYLHLFSPKLIILDEPDSHLHPNNQRLLCSLLSSISVDRGVQVLMTTHSRHVIDTLYTSADLLWVQNGGVSKSTPEDQVDILLELGALDIKERIQAATFKVIVLTEDAVSRQLQALLEAAGFKGGQYSLLPYNGVTSVHLLKPLIRKIKDITDASIIVHRDRDYMEPDEVAAWEKEIRAISATPFVTAGIDVESYFTTDDLISQLGKPIADFSLDDVKGDLSDGEQEALIASYVNGRVDLERKSGTIGKLDYGKLSAAAAKKVAQEPLRYMKGKRKLAKLRKVFQERYGVKFDPMNASDLPADKDLIAFASKHFRSGNP